MKRNKDKFHSTFTKQVHFFNPEDKPFPKQQILDSS